MQCWQNLFFYKIIIFFTLSFFVDKDKFHWIFLHLALKFTLVSRLRWSLNISFVFVYAPLWKQRHIVLFLSASRSVDQVMKDWIYFDPLAWKLPNLVQWVAVPYWFSGHMIKTIWTASLWTNANSLISSKSPFPW